MMSGNVCGGLELVRRPHNGRSGHGTTIFRALRGSAAVAARCEFSCPQLRFERSERVVSSQTTASTPRVVMGPKDAQQKLFLSRFTSRTRSPHAQASFTCPARKREPRSSPDRGTRALRVSTCRRARTPNSSRVVPPPSCRQSSQDDAERRRATRPSYRSSSTIVSESGAARRRWPRGERRPAEPDSDMIVDELRQLGLVARRRSASS